MGTISGALSPFYNGDIAHLTHQCRNALARKMDMSAVTGPIAFVKAYCGFNHPALRFLLLMSLWTCHGIVPQAVH